MSELESLGIKAVDQDELETSVTKKANEALISKDKELEEKRLEKTKADLTKAEKKISVLQARLNDPRTKISQRKQIKEEIEWFKVNELDPLRQDYGDISERLSNNQTQLDKINEARVQQSGNDRLPDETERDYLIRIGKITAFGNQNAFEDDEEQRSHIHLREPGFGPKQDEGPVDPVDPVPLEVELVGSGESDINDDDYTYDEPEIEDNEAVEVIDKQEAAEVIDKEEVGDIETDEKNIDDGNEENYDRRMKLWIKRRSQLRPKAIDIEGEEEQYKPHPTIPDSKLDDRFKLPGDIYPSLFDYQKTCVQWLWELYNQKTGGIIGDEMGLGKTIQVISFITGLYYSKLLDKPVLIVVPATVLNQWVNEFHKWWPPLRCVILHSIGSGMGKGVDESKIEEFLQNEDADEVDKSKFKGMSNKINAKRIIDNVMEKGHILITTYVGLRIYSDYLLSKQWGYCILDEGHKIRNPNLDISLLCKQIKTYNRIILSGTPIQNNLIELWSLFDFVFPGRLGTLPIFEQQFAIPINMGGYSNASNLQVQTSYKCATILKDLVAPYLLRRLKHDVARDLPKKQEMVLFIKLTKYQQDMYESFLQSEDLNAIVKGRRNMLMGVDVLRKICNHPDLVNKNKTSGDYGNSRRSGKMEVTKKLIQLWGINNHKILIFCQTKQMLDILEKFITKMKKLNVEDNNQETGPSFNYLRMDGSTPIVKRQFLVDSFNTNPNIDIFLLTTKVGGLGINLTGADRIIIYDPDWNPSTDIQARERAWRLGQKKDIVIYRLMITGSIEEKIYHRQIFKTFLTNKILKDPNQRKFFKMNDLYDLFTLGDQEEAGTETSQMFNSEESTYKGSRQRTPKKLSQMKHKNDDDLLQVASIMGVSKMDQFQGGEEPSEKDKPNDEEQIMEGIFKNSNVHSSLKHDDIIENKGNNNNTIQREVNKIAEQSIKLLNESRKLTRRNRVGVPTWTGKFGKAGRAGARVGGSGTKRRIDLTPSSSTRGSGDQTGDLSSRSILGAIKKKQKLEPNPETQNNELSGQITKLFDQQARLTSNQILFKLKDKVNINSKKDILLVKTLLRTICNWDSGAKNWHLKDEYRS